MKKKVFWSICLTSLASLLVMAACAVLLLYTKVDSDTWNNLESDAYYIAIGIEQGGAAYLTEVGGRYNRVTLIATDGSVLYDTVEEPSVMENHAERPEVAEALENGSGSSQRVSDTLGKRTLYFALRLGDGRVVRVAETSDTLLSETLRFIPLLLVIAFVVAVLASFFARKLTQTVVQPINEIDLEHPLESPAYGELSPLLRRIAKQNDEIDIQMEKLRENQLEFQTITESMDEGLIVLGTDSTVLSINSAARRILGTGYQECLHRHILELSRNLTLDKAVKTSLAGQKEEYVLTLDARKYRLMASPAMLDGAVNGVVLLMMDETEKLEAETLRREFSANVSHELKTPLTSISGYAEIIKKGIVKPDDIADFAGRIHDEANRLINLVGDIIKLSKLDEKETSFTPEKVDLLALACTAADDLRGQAGDKGVEVNISGAHIEVEGIRSILSEVVYNLLDNAIKYNREDGEVLVTVWSEQDIAYIKVSDTGTGISAEHQQRVFERFYRVDKSHSQEIGGTGLGLSIVKRGVLFHDGQISLESMPGKGSSFLVSLPL